MSHQEFNLDDNRRDSCLRKGEQDRRQMFSLAENEISLFTSQRKQDTLQNPPLAIGKMEESNQDEVLNQYADSQITHKTDTILERRGLVNLPLRIEIPSGEITSQEQISTFKLFPILTSKEQSNYKENSNSLNSSNCSPNKESQRSLVNILTSNSNCAYQENPLNFQAAQKNLFGKSYSMQSNKKKQSQDSSPLKRNMRRLYDNRIDHQDASPSKKQRKIIADKLIKSYEQSPNQKKKVFNFPLNSQNMIKSVKSVKQCDFSEESPLKDPNKLKKVWKQQGFMIITLVRKFALKMQNLSFIRRYNKQTFQQFKIINDQAAFYDSMRGNFYLDMNVFKQRIILLKQNILQNQIIARTFSFLRQKIKPLQPDSYLHVIWIIFINTQIIILLFLHPILLAFNSEMIEARNNYQNLEILLLRKMPMVVNIIDSMIHLNTAYYKRGIIVLDRFKIALHYLKGNMWLDLSMILAFSIYDMSNLSLLLIITFLLIKKIQILRKDLEDTITLPKKQRSIYELCKLGMFVIIIAHFCGCLFWFVGQKAGQYGYYSWIESSDLIQTAFFEKYVNCLYWATVTMLTVGYGDIIPKNSLEKSTVILIMIVSCGVYAYSLSKIGLLISQIPSEDEEFKKTFCTISLYMKKRNIEVKIQNEVTHQISLTDFLTVISQVKRYFQYLSWEKYNYSQNRDLMLNPLNSTLKQKVLMSINLQFLQQYKVFSLHFTQPFLQQLALVMKEQEYMPDDKIWESYDIESQNRMFFIVRGQVRQLVSSKFTVKIIEEGGYFNEKSFVIDEISEVSFISTCVTTIVFLDKNDFLEIIKSFPKDYEIYCKLRDQAKNLDFLSILDSKCETCEQFTHDFNSCPQVNCKISKEKLIYNSNLSIPQVRQKFKRPESNEYNQSSNLSFNSLIVKGRRINAVMQQIMIFDSVINYLIEYNPFDQSEEIILQQVKSIMDYDSKYQNDKLIKLEAIKKFQFHNNNCLDEISQDALSPPSVFWGDKINIKNPCFTKVVIHQSNSQRSSNNIQEEPSDRSDRSFLKEQQYQQSKQLQQKIYFNSNIQSGNSSRQSSQIEIPFSPQENLKGKLNEMQTRLGPSSLNEENKSQLSLNQKMILNISPYPIAQFQENMISPLPYLNQDHLPPFKEENEIQFQYTQNAETIKIHPKNKILKNQSLKFPPSKILQDSGNSNNQLHLQDQSDRLLNSSERTQFTSSKYKFEDDLVDFQNNKCEEQMNVRQNNFMKFPTLNENKCNPKIQKNKKKLALLDNQKPVSQITPLDSLFPRKNMKKTTATSIYDNQDIGEIEQSWRSDVNKDQEYKLFSDLPNLDKFQIFQYYFPYSNVDKVVVKLQQLNSKILAAYRRKKKASTTITKLEKYIQKINFNRSSIRCKSKIPSLIPQLRGRKQRPLDLNFIPVQMNQTISSQEISPSQLKRN